MPPTSTDKATIALFIENPSPRFHLQSMNKPQTTPLREAPVGVPGRYWEKLADGRIQCDLCPRFCSGSDAGRDRGSTSGRAPVQDDGQLDFAIFPTL